MAVWRKWVGAIVGGALLCGLPGCELPGCSGGSTSCVHQVYFGATGIPENLVLLPFQDSIEVRIVVRLTAEGAASEGADVLMHRAELGFVAVDQSGLRSSELDEDAIRSVRLTRADGSDVVLGSATDGVHHLATMENVLSGCAGAGCWAELIGVVELREIRESRSYRRRIYLGVSLMVELETCAEGRSQWVTVDVESIDLGGLDAGLPVDAGIPIDGGDGGSLDAGPPMLRCTRAGAAPAPAEPPCSPEEAACYRACADDACRLGCIDAATPPTTCSPCVRDQSFGCSLEICLDESNAWDCCVWSRCVDLPPGLVCEPCAAELAAMQACTSSEAFRMYCAPRVDACFPPP